MPRLIAYLVAVIVAIAWLPAMAEHPGAVGTALSDAQIEQRLDFIEQRLDGSELHAQVWYWSWLAINGGSAVGLSVAAALTDDAADRAAYIPQAALAALGVADLTLIRPLKARFGAALIRSLPGATHAQRLHKLERAEALLRANAMRAERRTWWRLHLANLGLNAAAAATTYATGRTSDAIVSLVTGFVAGEIFIWSAPGAPARDWQDYQRFKGGGGPAQGLRLSVVPGFGMLTLKLTW